MADATHDEWKFWNEARQGKLGPVVESNPQTGYWKHFSGHPVAIWREEGTLYVMLGEDHISDPVEQGRIWLASAKAYPPSFEQYEIRMATGMWPGLPEKLAAAADEAERGAGDNSGDLTEFQRMRAEIMNDISEARAYYAKHKIATKDDADKAQDWGDRLTRSARTADQKRLAETKPLRDQIEEINTRWNAIIREANRQGIEVVDLAQQWGKAEAARLRKIAEDEAKAKWEAEQAEKQRAAEDERKAALALGVTLEPTPEAAPPSPPPTPVVAAPKVMIGTGTHGNRRSVKTDGPATATIVDLKAAALHFASVNSPEMIDLVQKLANRAIKARAPIPGIRFSWEEKAKENA